MRSDEQWLFLQDVALLIAWLAISKKYKATGGDLLRSPIEQQRKVARGLSKTLHSRHLEKQAIDLNFWVRDRYVMDLPRHQLIEYLRPVGEYWESLNRKNRAGMFWLDPFDPGHFERRAA